MEGKEGVRVLFSSRFVRSVKQISADLQQKIDERIRTLEAYPFHASLKTHKLHGKHSECWAFRVTGDYRVIFRFHEKGVVLLEALVSHDDYDRV